jgi:ferritin-like metal-binding protein YciE
MSDKLKNLNDLFQHEIKDLYSAEKQILDALPKMAEAASNSELKQAFKDHLQETRGQKERLEKIADICGFDIDGETCEAAKGLIKEGESIIKMNANEDVRDAGLIAAAQRVEHYEMAGYGTACTYAKQLGHDKALDLLKETLDQEKSADDKLKKLATSKINEKAEQAV